MTSVKRNINVSDKYFPLVEKLFNYNQHKKLFDIDFSKKWYYVFTNIKLVILSTLIVESVVWIFITTAPIIIGNIFEEKSTSWFLLLCISFIGTWFIGIINGYFYVEAASRLKSSFTTKAYEFYISRDPIFHTKRSSGKIISKITSASDALENLIGVFAFSLLPVLITVITLVVTFSKISLTVGALLSVFFVLIIVFTVLAQIKNVDIVIPQDIKIQDRFTERSVEMLQQIFLVRSTFSTTNELQKLYKTGQEQCYIQSNVWMTFPVVNSITRLIYTIANLVLIYYLLTSHENSMILNISLSFAFFSAYSLIVSSGSVAERVFKSISKIQDLYKNMKEFGENDITITSANIPIEQFENLSIEVDNLNFNYEQHTKVFKNTSIFLYAQRKNTHKLYGIIGPSGTGKSTLLNIMGGQLIPSSGSVKIDGYNIYDVGEKEKRKLLGVQLQTASNLRGSLKSNLTFGVSKSIINSQFTDQRLVELLEQVGLWELFAKQEGLRTFIGEGGVTMSGGQRQRLNFASLYLRTLVYKPSIVLIDEPTSSLDEINEKTITAMIDEIARNSITFVVAHRLKTLDNAIGILDTSLFQTQSHGKFMNKTELLEKSPYYQDLKSGKAQLS